MHDSVDSLLHTYCTPRWTPNSSGWYLSQADHETLKKCGFIWMHCHFKQLGSCLEPICQAHAKRIQTLKWGTTPKQMIRVMILNYWKSFLHLPSWNVQIVVQRHRGWEGPVSRPHTSSYCSMLSFTLYIYDMCINPKRLTKRVCTPGGCSCSRGWDCGRTRWGYAGYWGARARGQRSRIPWRLWHWVEIGERWQIADYWGGIEQPTWQNAWGCQAFPFFIFWKVM